ncbi:hypothetical protein Q5H93_23070 [Hymenobacter sp. ASUV-10]|uniref:ArsR family transcriptional regulator n=1 Tax=Hymenobacter aranciens TaxID=3063996 RepID=A0ABT9BHA1_9BACT|nr:hypothetical protein [Hymenobacter sp. ASUV-10]MDO7877640.1 hypothetical protein [Hymenobacter sp. ASUV-10]
MATPATSSIEPLLDGLADRIARRDLPPPVADPYAPAQVMKRLSAALKVLDPVRNRRGRHSQGKMLLQYLEHEAQTAADLARAAGIGRVAGSRAHGQLVAVGLLRWAYEGPRRVYRLTRWGEDWLLALGRNERLPERPAG